MKKISKILLAIFSLFIGFTCLLAVPAYAAGNNGGSGDSSSSGDSGGSDKETSESKDVCESSVPDSVKEAAGCKGNDNKIVGIIQFILNSIIAAIGIIAVIYIVIGGVNFMTSTGDPGKVAKARQTILYAVIGLIICALAFVIVNWVIGVITTSSS